MVFTCCKVMMDVCQCHNSINAIIMWCENILRTKKIKWVVVFTKIIPHTKCETIGFESWVTVCVGYSVRYTALATTTKRVRCKGHLR